MPTDPTALYFRLRELVETIPKLDGTAPLTNDDQLWLGRAYAAVVDVNGDVSGDTISFAVATGNLSSAIRDQNAQLITAILYRALAVAERKAPAQARGGFIPVGSPLDALASIGKVLGTASKDVLIVDAYMDNNTVTDFAVLVPEGVPIRLLADAAFVRPGLEPAVSAWIKQYTTARPLEARITVPRELHDRFVQIDHAEVWLLSQSLNAFAKRSSATVSRAEPEIAQMKIDAYERIWKTGRPIA